MSKKIKAVLHIVTAPNTWHCKCGKEIKAGEQCGKIGKQIVCMKCLEGERNLGESSNLKPESERSHQTPEGGTLRVTKSGLIGVAIQSIRQKNSLSMFWEYVSQARKIGMLDMTDAQIHMLVEEHESVIYGKGLSYREQDSKLSTDVSTYGLDESSYRSKIVEGGYLGNISSRAKDITPLKAEIPNYLEVIQPRPVKVYLIDRLLFWPLFKVAAVFRGGRAFVAGSNAHEDAQLYLVGVDRHTKQPFALGIPNGFVDMPMDACLRWTLNAHKGDKVIEV